MCRKMKPFIRPVNVEIEPWEYPRLPQGEFEGGKDSIAGWAICRDPESWNAWHTNPAATFEGLRDCLNTFGESVFVYLNNVDSKWMFEIFEELASRLGIDYKDVETAWMKPQIW